MCQTLIFLGYDLKISRIFTYTKPSIHKMMYVQKFSCKITDIDIAD